MNLNAKHSSSRAAEGSKGRERERGRWKERKLRQGVVLDLAFQFILLSAAFCGFARCNCGSGWDGGRKEARTVRTDIPAVVDKYMYGGE